MANCDFCNLGDCVQRDAVRKFETMVVLIIKVLGYVCSVACGVMFGVGIADCITADGFNNVALLLPVQIAAGTFIGGCVTVMCLIAVDELIDL